MATLDSRTSIIAHAARHGWLIATPLRVLAGWGHAHATPQYEGHRGFASLNFDGDVRVVYPDTTVVVDSTGISYVGSETGPMTPTPAPLPAITVTSDSAAAYRTQVQAALAYIESGGLEKVVLARPFEADSESPVDEASVALALRAIEPTATIYSFPAPNGGRFVGASPELLLEQHGSRIRLEPLAGTAPRGHEDELLGSKKDRHEHSVMIVNLSDRLRERGVDVSVGPLDFRELSSVVHLATTLTGELPDGLRDPQEIAAIVHPTAAVAGIPLEVARKVIEELEVTDRDMYAGAVGWIEGPDQAQWWVAIRGLIVNGTHLRFWAGAGIVKGSTPESEIAETELKFRSVAKIFPTIS